MNQKELCFTILSTPLVLKGKQTNRHVTRPPYSKLVGDLCIGFFFTATIELKQLLSPVGNGPSQRGSLDEGASKLPPPVPPETQWGRQAGSPQLRGSSELEPLSF